MSALDMILLYDYYGDLLTQRQRECFEMRYNQDLSLGEIGEILGISRQGVHEAVKTASGQLIKYEETLGIARRYMGIRREVISCREALEKVHTDEEGNAALNEARMALDRIDGIER